MTAITGFTFNPFQENTYVVYDETKECIIVDPGCSTTDEEKELGDFIEAQKLKPVLLVNTHCHIDHVLGNRFVADRYNLKFAMHQSELPVLNAAGSSGALFGIVVPSQPKPEIFLKEGDKVKFGNSELEVLFTPGHTPGEICLFCKAENFVIAGDVIFLQSIGRTDLPGGNYETLIESIKTKLLTLRDDVKVYSGHGPETTIGFERKNNPFLR